MIEKNLKKDNEFNSVNSDTIPLDSRIQYENDKADIILTGCTAQGPSMTNGNYFINKDTMPLNTPVKPEYDTERVQKYENNNLASSSCHSRAMTRESRNIDTILTGCSAQGPSMTKGNNALSSSDNDTHTLSPLGEQSIFPTLSPSGVKQTTLPLLPSDTDTSSLSFPCLTRESSGKIDHCFSGYSRGSTNMTKGNNTLSMINEDNAPSMTKGNETFSPSDTDTSSLSFPCLTRGSSRKMKHCFSGYSRGSTNMTRMISQSDRIPPSVTLGRSETKTRGSRITNAYASAFRIAQSGRSMVEMLGVLAVIGVLSIGGIMGYSYGMDKYRANETINELTTRALGLMQQIASNNITELNMEMGYETKLGYPIDAWRSEQNPNYFYIAIGDIPPEVCRQILKQNWILPTDILLGGTDYSFYHLHKNRLGLCDTTDLQMDFEFYLDFGKSGTVPDFYVEETPWPEEDRKICDDPNTPLGDGQTCYPCSETRGIYVRKNGKCQSVCPNRRLVNGYCIIP